MEHTKEPWEFVESDDNLASADIVEDCISGSIKGDDWYIARIWGDNGAGLANARRIVACVNACIGIPTEDLERFGLAALNVTCNKVAAQRDELLMALTGVLAWASEVAGDIADKVSAEAELKSIEAAYAAIAKAEQS